MSSDILKLSVDLIKRCPVCLDKCTTSEGKVLETTEEHSVTHFCCDACKSSFLMHLIHYPFGVIGSVMLTDLSAREARTFQKTPAVDADDVLEIHSTLQNQQVEKLFVNSN